MVGIVVVSHSSELARGLAELAGQMAGPHVRIGHAGGTADGALHARPAAQLVRTALRFSAQIGVVVNGREANAKSLLAVLALGAVGGTPLRLSASGSDAAAALEALGACVAGFED